MKKIKIDKVFYDQMVKTVNSFCFKRVNLGPGKNIS